MDYDTYFTLPYLIFTWITILDFTLLHLIFTWITILCLTLHADNDTYFTSPDLHLDNDTYFPSPYLKHGLRYLPYLTLSSCWLRFLTLSSLICSILFCAAPLFSRMLSHIMLCYVLYYTNVRTLLSLIIFHLLSRVTSLSITFLSITSPHNHFPWTSW